MTMAMMMMILFLMEDYGHEITYISTKILQKWMADGS